MPDTSPTPELDAFFGPKIEAHPTLELETQPIPSPAGSTDIEAPESAPASKTIRLAVSDFEIIFVMFGESLVPESTIPIEGLPKLTEEEQRVRNYASAQGSLLHSLDRISVMMLREGLSQYGTDLLDNGHIVYLPHEVIGNYCPTESPAFCQRMAELISHNTEPGTIEQQILRAWNAFRNSHDFESSNLPADDIRALWLSDKITEAGHALVRNWLTLLQKRPPSVLSQETRVHLEPCVIIQFVIDDKRRFQLVAKMDLLKAPDLSRLLTEAAGHGQMEPLDRSVTAFDLKSTLPKGDRARSPCTRIQALLIQMAATVYNRTQPVGLGTQALARPDEGSMSRTRPVITNGVHLSRMPADLANSQVYYRGPGLHPRMPTFEMIDLTTPHDRRFLATQALTRHVEAVLDRKEQVRNGLSLYAERFGFKHPAFVTEGPVYNASTTTSPALF